MSEVLSKEEKLAIAKRAYNDPVFFCRFFLEHLFPQELPWFQRALLAILTRKCGFLEQYGEVDKIIREFTWLDSNGDKQHIFYRDEDGTLQMRLRRFTEIMIPRGYAKTTTAGVAVPLYELLYQDVDFTVYVSHAAPHAKMQIHNVQRELIDNSRIREIFGDQKPKVSDEEKWGQDMFETLKGVAMAARGSKGQIRGMLHRGARPKKIIVDDLEDKESVSTQEQRDKLREWFYADLKPALPRMDPNATIVVLGTLLHREALLETLAADEDWTTVRLAAVDSEGVPIWPEMYDLEELAREKASYAAAGLIHVWYMEFMNQAVAPEAQIFVPEFFVYKGPPTNMLTACYMDPAISKKRTADHTVIIGGGICPDDGQIYVTHLFGDIGVSENEKVTRYFEFQRALRSRQNGIESNAYQQALVETFRTEMFRRGQYFEITPVTHKLKKTERIRGVLRIPFFNRRIVFCDKWNRLEGQLLDFRPDVDDQPDDYPDALAGLVKLLDPYAAAAAGEVDLTEDEYEPLEEDFGRWAC